MTDALSPALVRNKVGLAWPGPILGGSIVVEIEFPLEFFVEGTAVSLQAQRRESLDQWKTRIVDASRLVLPEGHFATEASLAITLYYFPDAEMQGDIDNIVQPILNALKRHVYMDDRQIERVLIQKFEPGNVFVFSSPSPILADALQTEAGALYSFVRQAIRGFDLMSLPETREADVLDSLLPRYQAEGYEVYLNPSPSILPPFMQAHRPDAIALRTDKKIAIEIVRSTSASARKIQELQSLFATHRDWELRVHYISPLSPEQVPEVVSQSAIDAGIERVRDLVKDGHRLPAVIMSWATLEAIGRALLPEELKRPQTPARLIEVLASEGYLTPQEADTLRQAISVRNAAVHGGIDQSVDDELLGQFATILQVLAKFVIERDTPERRL